MVKQLTIEGFASNCLMGVIGAISKYKGYTENINKLYFHSSYVYKKMEDALYDVEQNRMNVEFSRELPMKKETFMKRLNYYYGLDFFYQEFSDFDKLVNVLEQNIKNDEPVIVEIDFFFMTKYRHYQKVHSQHMMIIEDIDREKEKFQVCEAVLGHFDMPFSEYQAYFQDVIQNRKRNVYLLKVRKTESDVYIKICKEWFLEDIDVTYKNLSEPENSGIGMHAFTNFRDDFMQLLQVGMCRNDIIIPGMWVFMCDNMNNVNFIQEWKKGYPDFHSDALENVKKSSVVINRKWFYITMALKDISKYKQKDFEKAFLAIEKEEVEKVQNLVILKNDIERFLN